MSRNRFGYLYLILLLVFAAWSVLVRDLLLERSRVSFLKEDFYAAEDFREMDIASESADKLNENASEELSESELLTLIMLNGRFHPANTMPELPGLTLCRELYLKYKPREYQSLLEYYRAVWEDVEYFPAASRGICFENSWMKEQDYEGGGRHEGTDLTGNVQKSGYVPVISMTGGLVESTGWTPEYGNQIIIRAGHGGYFLYAHLSSCEKDFQRGESVSAGDILGYMGNSGSGGMDHHGRLPVFLHVGISIQGPDGIQYTVNPFAVLKYAVKKIRIYNIH